MPLNIRYTSHVTHYNHDSLTRIYLHLYVCKYIFLACPYSLPYVPFITITFQPISNQSTVIYNSILVTCYWPFATLHPPTVTRQQPLATPRSLLATCYSLLATHHSLILTPCYSPLATHHSLLTTQCSLLLTPCYSPHATPHSSPFTTRFFSLDTPQSLLFESTK